MDPRVRGAGRPLRRWCLKPLTDGRYGSAYIRIEEGEIALNDCEATQEMTNESSLMTFTIDEPGHRALRMVRRALALHGLQIAAELDVTLRIEQELGAEVAPSVVLSVDDPALLLEGIVFHRGAALEIPQPVVVSGGDRHTEVLVRSVESLIARGLPLSVQNPALQLQARIVRAIETVADRVHDQMPVSA